MNKIETLKEIIGIYLYEMFRAIATDIDIKCANDEDEHKYIFLIEYSIIRFGKIYRDYINYTVYESDLECEFPYIVNMALCVIADKVADEMVRICVEYVQGMGVI